MNNYDGIMVALTLLWVLGLRSMWRRTGWLPRTLYVAGGMTIGVSVLWIRLQPLWVAGLMAVLLSRVLPAHGWHRQPGEG